MPAMTKQLFIPFKDLRLISIGCEKCEGGVTLDISRNAPGAETSWRTYAPAICPSCHAPINAAIRENIDFLRNAYEALSGFDRTGFLVNRSDEK
jgi:hypothetical protein